MAVGRRPGSCVSVTGRDGAPRGRPLGSLAGVTASLATLADLEWIVALLARRRRPLVSYAPIFWRPAPDASTHHRAYLEYLLVDGGAHAYRTPASVLIAVPRGDGWLVDDAFVPGEDWAGDGRVLWDALAADCGGSEVRFVCPTYERARADFARAAGLTVAETWWLMELPGSGGGEAGAQIELPGAGALTVGAPAVYAPPGPILFLPALTDAERAVPAAIATAPDIGWSALVVNQLSSDDALVSTLTDVGLRRHCEYCTGEIQRVRGTP